MASFHSIPVNSGNATSKNIFFDDNRCRRLDQGGTSQAMTGGVSPAVGPRVVKSGKRAKTAKQSGSAKRAKKPADDFSLSLLVSDALTLLDLVGADRAHVVGNSAGGYVSQQLAINHPTRVSSLALPDAEGP
jgi:pimeloyl-ACP methyl ester carboxylesterase